MFMYFLLTDNLKLCLSNLTLTPFEPKFPDNELALPKVQADPRSLTSWYLQFTLTPEHVLMQFLLAKCQSYDGRIYLASVLSIS